MVELAGIIILGIGAQWLSWKMKVPAILPLILLGLLVGPFSTLWTADGQKWLEPIYNRDSNIGIFPERYFFYFVSLAIGIILFEGGLTLKRKEIRNLGPVILRLVSLGSLVTLIGAALSAHFILGLSFGISLLFGALIIVTGPTVIAPILQNVSLNRNISTILKWESIIIDPIGALAAVLVFEFILSNRGPLAFTPVALLGFTKVVLTGFIIGVSAGYLLYYLIKQNLIPKYLLNVFTLATVLGVFVLSDLFAKESGLLSVVVMGTVLGNLDMPKLKDILDFKESLSVLLISILFIVLAAHINLEDLSLLKDWRCFALLAMVILVLRPLGVFVSTRGGELPVNEKLFVSLIGPRGIVAAGIASLFGLRLVSESIPGAEYITPLVFMVVLGTVLLSAVGARPFARFFGVMEKRNNGILIVGADRAARLLGAFFKDQGRRVLMVDMNASNLRKASEEDIEVYQADIYQDDFNELFDVENMQYLLAMTGSGDVNRYACKTYKSQFNSSNIYVVLQSSADSYAREQNIQSLAPFDDHIDLMEVARDHPQIHLLNFAGASDLKEKIESMNPISGSIPLCLWSSKGEILPLVDQNKKLSDLKEGSVVYLGKTISSELKHQDSQV
ncbi:MAG: sodium:proton antiporter [Saprospiraceae bacterium]|nr:sodium:proton antiporter [Saprospiraceae bacterium]